MGYHKWKIWKRLLQSLKDGCTVTKACEAAGVSRGLFYSWCDKSFDFNAAVERIKSKRPKMVADVLFQKCLDGDTQAIKYYLNNRDKFNWAERHEIEHTGSVDLGLGDIVANVKRLKESNDRGPGVSPQSLAN